MDHDDEPEGARRFWEERYSSSGRTWSGRVNAQLAEVAAGLPPGSALDLGSGEGADALWLAAHGSERTLRLVALVVGGMAVYFATLFALGFRIKDFRRRGAS